MVNVFVYPQDPFVGEPEIRTMEAGDINPGLVNSRLRVLVDGQSPVQPDLAGNYIFQPSQPAFNQVNAFYYANFTLRMWETYAGRSIPWGCDNPVLTVNPQMGEGVNAFYDESGSSLGFQMFKVAADKAIYAAQSADVVSHEAAHAVLDGLRDFYNESFGLGATAYHEAFADMTAVLVALHDKALVERLLNWTAGELRLDNFVTRLADQMSQPLQGRSLYLRNALNNLKAKPFDDLVYHPADADLELGREPHNYSRLLTGALYDLLALLYEYDRVNPVDPLALYRMRDMLGRMMICAVEAGPVGELDMQDVARAFLTADRVLHNSAYAWLVKRVFAQRGILSADESAAHLAQLDALPALHLPHAATPNEAAAQFLRDNRAALGLPENDALKLYAVRRNADGLVFITYSSTVVHTFKGEGFGDYSNRQHILRGGLSLLFDADGLLRSAYYRPVTAEDERQLDVMALEYERQNRLVSSEEAASWSQRLLANVRPKGVWQVTMQGLRRLVRFPVLFDQLMPPKMAFQEYLQAWAAHIEREG